MKIYHIRKLSGQDTDFRPTILNSLKQAQVYKQNHPDDTVNVYIASGFFDDISTYPSLQAQNLQNSLTKDIDNCFLLGAYGGKKNLYFLALTLKNKHTCNVKLYYKWKFHAKIFVITVNDLPVFEIIGSSNMTRSAYCGITPKKQPSLNFECDLVIFNEEMINVVIDTSPRIMQLRYCDEDNRGITITTRMFDIMSIIREFIKDANKLEI